MQGTSLKKQERECKLYDKFDKFAYKKGETLREFYLKFSLLLNDMNIYNMKLEQFKVNTKFLNTLPPEWSKFVTDVKLSPQYGSPYQSQQYSTHQSSTPLSITYPSNEYQSSIHHNVYSPSLSIPQLEYAPSVNQQSEFSQPDSGLIVPVFQKGDDPIDAINHMISFLTAVVTSRYPTTNNHLRNSSNSRTYTPGASRSHSGKQRTVVCYNYKWEGHMSKQCTKPKMKRDDSWFKDKVLLVQAQASGQILHEEELAFLADPRIPEVALMANLSHYGSDSLTEVHNPDNENNNMINQVVQVMPSSEQSNVVNHSETEITSDSNIIPYSQYVIESQQAAVQNSNSSPQQDALILSVIEQLKSQVVNCTKINLENKSVNNTLTAELERYKEQVKVLKEGQNVDLRSNDNVSDSSAQSVEIDRLKQTLFEHLKEKESLMQTVSLLKDDFKKEESRNIDRKIALEKRIKQLDNIKAQQLEPKLYVGNVIEKTNAIVIPDSEETLLLAEESHLKMLLKQKDPILRVPYDQRNNPPQHTRIVYPPILNINYFRHFLDILRNYDPKDDEPMWVADRVVAPTLGSAITIPETANEFAIKGNIIKIFYHRLSEITQEVLNAAAGGIFLYKTPNQAYQLLEDKVLLKLDWVKNQKTKSSLKKTAAFPDEGSSNTDTDSAGPGVSGGGVPEWMP
ncbi:hypothetical protein Tco_1408669 [Tanacetum coccineum]